MHLNKLAWQINALDLISSKDNVILSSPTGSGKTLVFMEWALEKDLRIIITSPIKALSSQRFRELLSKGYKVALETGDIKYIPKDWQILCCTSEIYALKYVKLTDIVVIMDEFHYCFENSERSRAFIDGIVYSEARCMCICSATLGNIDLFQAYLERISKRKFTLCLSDERITELRDIGRVHLTNIKNALIVSFSVDNCNKILDFIKKDRASRFYPNKKTKVNKKYKKKLDSYYSNSNKIDIFAEQFNVNGFVVENAKLGLALFHGKILPKEKDFIATLFEEKIIDTVIGTDALSIGVNFPVETVIFCQLVKYPGTRISKNMFDQIAGRAGRKGYFDIGYYGFCDEIEGIEFKGFNTDSAYKSLRNKKNESFVINLTPRYDLLLQNKISIENEVNYIVKYSSIRLSKEYVEDEIISTINEIKEYPLISFMSKKQNIEFERFIPICYFNEFDTRENCEILHELLKLIEIQDNIMEEFEKVLSLKESNLIAEYLEKKYHLSFKENVTSVLNEELSYSKLEKALAINNTNYLIDFYYKNVSNYYLLLKLRKYLTSLPNGLSNAIDVKTIEDKINSIDSTSLNYVEISLNSN